MRFCLGPVCWFTLMEEGHKCSVCPNSPGRPLDVPRFVGCSNTQADLPLTRQQRKVAKCYSLHHVCLSACIKRRTADRNFMISNTGDFYLNFTTHSGLS
jgi:hypothetical protein